MPLGLGRTYRQLAGNSALIRLLAGEFVSSIGDWLYLVALIVIVDERTHSAVLLGIVGAARILPYILLSVPAGILVDRFDRRLILLITDVARGLAMLALAYIALTDGPIEVTIAIAILATCFSVFFGPAIGAYLPSLVRDESELGPANSLWSTLDNLAFVIGPAIAGLLIAFGGLPAAFLLNAASFAVVAVVLWRLPPQVSAAPKPPSDDEPLPGAAETSAEPALPPSTRMFGRALVGPIAVDSAISFVGGGIGILTVILATDVLRAGAAATGFLNAAVGVGGLVGAVLAGALVLRRLGLPLAGGLLATAVGLVVLAWSRSLEPALLAMAVVAGGGLVVEVINTTIVQRTVPDAFRGRVTGLMQMISAAAYTMGAFLAPVLASIVGAEVVLLGLAAVSAAGVAGLALMRRESLAPQPVDAGRVRVLRSPFLSGLPPARLEAAARKLISVPTSAGAVVVRQGDVADRFYVIDSGTVRVTQVGADGQTGVLREMGPTEVFGEIGLLTSAARTATVTAITDGQLYALNGPDFLELVSAGPGLSSRLLDLHRGASAIGSAD